MWVMLPQLKGEFFLYHFLESYMLHFENYLLKIRMQISSMVTSGGFKVSHYILTSCLANISGECILQVQEMAEKACDLIEKEIL